MRCKKFLTFLAMLSFALTATTIQAVTLDADGFVTAGANPPEAFSLDGYIDFAVLSASSTQQDSSFNGSAAKPIGTLIDLIKELMIMKIMGDTPCSTDPPPDEGGEPLTLAAITNETYQGDFTVVTPDFEASGIYTRTPALLDIDFELTVGFGLPELTGFYSFEALTLPAGPGSAEQEITIGAEMVGGGIYEFTQNTTLTFDSMVKLSMPQFSVGSETITIIGDEVSYAGTVQVTMVPEPSTLVLLGLGAAGLLAYALRRRR